MNDFYFVHIPKTGGRYALNALEGIVNNIGHHGYRETMVRGWGSWKDTNRLHKYSTFGGYIRHNIPPRKLITIIRNPFDFLGSYYHYRSHDNCNGWGNCNEIHNIKTFDQFLDYFLDDCFEWHFPAFQSNLFWQIFNNGDLLPFKENIFKIESLNIDLKNFIERNNLPDIIYKDHTPATYIHLYNKKHIDIITHKFKFLFDFFKY